jgi:hypothetical protein
MDDRLYPQGKGGIKSRYLSNGQLVFYSATGTELFRINPSISGGYVMPGMVKHIRRRFTVSEVNAGASLLAAVTGFKYRMISARAISVGGAAGAVTTVDIIATLSASTRKLVAFAQASLTQSAVLKDGDAASAVLADGASYTQNDAATAVTVGKTGASVTVATHIDISFTYALEA